MKKKRLAIILSSLAVVALIGGTYAAFTASTKTEHKVSTTELGIELKQKGDTKKQTEKIAGFGNQETTAGISYKGLPGDTVEEKVWVENTKTETCFIRVTVNRSWMKESKDGQFEKTFEDGVDPKQIDIISDNGWYVREDPDDSEVLYFYYKEAVPAGRPTTNVMKAFSILKDHDGSSNDYAGLAANIVFEADAIQSYAAEDAMLAEWGVIADIEGDQITSTPQFQ